MTTVRQKFRKRPRQSLADESAFATALRAISRHIQHRDYASGLAQAEQWLASGGLSPHKQARVLALVGDSEFKRGAFVEAADIYLQCASANLDHPFLWLRPLLGHVHALLKAADVDQALLMARHTLDMSRQKRAGFDEEVRAAKLHVHEHGSVNVPRLPPRVGGVASRLGLLFLREGEPAAAKEFLDQAVEANPRHAARARQGLARIALGMDQPGLALRLANQSLRMGKFSAGTIEAWAILIAARRRLGGDMIRQSLLRGLDAVPPSVRSRAILVIVRELRKNNMRQWRHVAQGWLEREGGDFPIVTAEIRKLILASWKTTTGNAEKKRLAAEELLQTPGLSRSEWLAAAKEVVRAGLWEGREIDLQGMIQDAADRFRRGFTPRVTHSLALSCMMAKRHDLARPLLQYNLDQIPATQVSWAKSAWALARMESFLGNHAVASAWYRKYFECESMPLRFRLQARILWAEALLKSGQSADLLEYRDELTASLENAMDPELMMNFARQLQFAPGELRTWSNELFEQAEATALQQFRDAVHPSVAIAILFKLARRQVYDFARSTQAIEIWEELDDDSRHWLWSTNTQFWEYLGLLVEAYSRTSRLSTVTAFAAPFLDDAATPVEGLVHVGIPYARALISFQDASAAFPLFNRLIAAAPSHPLCAYAWYWKALEARRAGDLQSATRFAGRMRSAQGIGSGLLAQWDLDAKALLLLADLETEKVDPEAVNYTPGRLAELRDEIVRDLELLP